MMVNIGHVLEFYQLTEATVLYLGLVEGCIFGTHYPHALCHRLRGRVTTLALHTVWCIPQRHVRCCSAHMMYRQLGKTTVCAQTDFAVLS